MEVGHFLLSTCYQPGWIRFKFSDNKSQLVYCCSVWSAQSGGQFNLFAARYCFTLGWNSFQELCFALGLRIARIAWFHTDFDSKGISEAQKYELKALGIRSAFGWESGLRTPNSGQRVKQASPTRNIGLPKSWLWCGANVAASRLGLVRAGAPDLQASDGSKWKICNLNGAKIQSSITGRWLCERAWAWVWVWGSDGGLVQVGLRVSPRTVCCQLGGSNISV